MVEELDLGSIKQRAKVIELLGRLKAFPILAHNEIPNFVDRKRLWGKGLSSVDVHLLGSVALVPGAHLWTRDKRLIAASRQTRIHLFGNQ